MYCQISCIMCKALHEHYNKVLLSHKFSVIILIPTPLRLNLQVWIVCPWGVKREAHVTGYFQQVHAWLDSAREDGIIYECVVFQVFYWLFEWFTHSFNGNLAVYEQGFVPLNSCLVEQILVFIWHLVVGSGTHWKINLEIASSYARLGMFHTALIFLILECRHEPVMKQKIPRQHSI